MIFLYILLIGIFCVVMVRATDLMMDAVRTLILSTRIGAYGIASFLLAFSTSLPELMVGISAGLQNQPDLVLGNVIGSNIANLSLILGGAAALSGVLKATDRFVKRDVFYVFLAGSLPLVLMIDGALDRLDGVILILVYVIYNLTILERKRERLARREVHESPFWRRIIVRVSHVHVDRSVTILLVGSALLIVAADMVVRLAIEVATITQLPVILVGLFVVAVGTSLPELVFEIVAIRKGEVAMAFGNILGSVVTNSTLIIGVTLLISEIRLDGGMSSYLIASIAFVIVFFVFWLMVWTKHVLERWEGALLVVIYAVFAVLEILRVGRLPVLGD
jgi:cation:H+ antiporter